MTISVITPVYNAEKYIRKAVESALQFNEVKEIILVEDKSPDNALEICKALEREYEQVKLFQHPNGENRGAGESRNLAIQHATSEYIAFLDADDYFLPNRFDEERTIFKNEPNVDGVYSAIGVHFYSDNAKQLFKEKFNLANDMVDAYLTTMTKKIEPKNLFDTLLGLNGPKVGYFSIDGLTIKRKALDSMDRYFDTSLRLHQDTEFLLRLSYYSSLVPGSIQKAVSNRGVHEENRITNVNSEVKYATNYFNFYSILHSWAQKEKLKTNYVEHFDALKMLYHIRKEKSIKKVSLYVGFLLTTKRFFKNQEYMVLHRRLFKGGAIKKIYLKLVRIFQ